MQLVINTYGSYLHKDKNCFELKVEGEKKKISTKKVDSILIATGVSLSSDAIELALSNNIEIQFLDDYGQPAGKIWHPKLGSTTAIRRRQLEILKTEEGTTLVKKWMSIKAENYAKHLEELGRRRNEEKEQFVRDLAQEIRAFKVKLKNIHGLIKNIRNKLMSYEGNIGRKYIEGLSFLVPSRYEFEGRSQRPAQDEFNCLLNYGYGVLYSKVEKACILAGLDPYIGILHTDGYNKRSFVFDVIELYRHHISKLVMKLLARKRINISYFDEISGGLTLNEKGKEFFIKKLNKYFDKKVEHKGQNMKRENTIQADMHSIANNLIDE